ncbi:MAG: hypothetical protein WCF84_22490 [Anaerolineae bacterium]
MDAELARAFERIELYYHVNLLYGIRHFGGYAHELLLIDPQAVVESTVSLFKYYLWTQYSIQSERYDASPEYERYIAAAEPSFAALQALTGAGEIARPPRMRASREARSVMLAHDWFGVPLALCARKNQEQEREPCRYRMVFYAHEAPTIRHLVEDHPGHDTRVYNVIKTARRAGLHVEDVFGDQRGLFQHALFMAGTQLDHILTVSHMTREELGFLAPALGAYPIGLVYNGVPDTNWTLAERQASRGRMQQYTETLLGYRPNWILTHVGPPELRHALWRDLNVMEELDHLFAESGERAVLFMNSATTAVERRTEDVLRWEHEYGWPVFHRAGNGDLAGAEIGYDQDIQVYNRQARASQVVLVNQPGWGREYCGLRMPADMQPADNRNGTDVEFGQSIYEPFGASQVEALAAGAIVCTSNVCGCVGLLRQVEGNAPSNLVIGDYVTLPLNLQSLDPWQLTRIDRRERDIIEAAEATRLASRIFERLPRSEEAMQSLLDGSHLGAHMSWKVTVEQDLLPTLLGLF